MQYCFFTCQNSQDRKNNCQGPMGCRPFSGCILYFFTPESLCFSHTGLLAVSGTLQILQAGCGLGAFAAAVPFPWNVLAPEDCLSPFLQGLYSDTTSVRLSMAFPFKSQSLSYPPSLFISALYCSLCLSGFSLGCVYVCASPPRI